LFTLRNVFLYAVKSYDMGMEPTALLTLRRK
jgi:hypothetical protein